MSNRSTFSRVRGDTWIIEVAIADTDDAGASTPYAGLADAGVVCTIRRAITGALLWSGSKAAGVVVNDPTAGRVRATVPASATVAAAPGAYDVDVEVTAGGRVVTPFLGTLSVEADVTIP